VDNAIIPPVPLDGRLRVAAHATLQYGRVALVHAHRGQLPQEVRPGLVVVRRLVVLARGLEGVEVG